MSDKKLWAGRFSEPTDAFVEAFTASVEFDKRLAPYDIQGSIAHAMMLAAQGVLTEDEKNAIITGLTAILQKVENDEFEWSVQLEDVHMNIEAALTADIGDAGKKYIPVAHVTTKSPLMFVFGCATSSIKSMPN